MVMKRTLGSVTALWRYPVSSLAGERRADLDLTGARILGDRRFALVDVETGRPVDPAQKRWIFAPRIAARLEADGTPRLSLDGETWAKAQDQTLRRQLDAGFGSPVRIEAYGEKAGARHRYAVAPLHLLSQQSIAALRRLAPGVQIDERRFRPNVMVDLPGTPDACPEYALIGQEFHLGQVRLRGLAKAARCSFTTLAQQGLPADRAILKALIAHFHRNFGIYCEVLDDGRISTGDGLQLDLPEAVDPVVIVGAGQAAASAARALRENGYRGEIRLFGDESRPPYERPPLSKSLGEDLHLTQVLATGEAADPGIRLHLGETISAIDRLGCTVRTSDGASYGFGRLVLATGGSPRRLASVGRGHGRILTLRTAEDAQRLSAAIRNAGSVFVLGAGWLGLEIAATARMTGLQVTLFGKDDRLCPKALPQAVAEAVAALHRSRGVRLMLGQKPEFEESGTHVTARFAGGTEIADLLVVAIGMTPNEALAVRSGLACRDGVLTDEDGATDDPAVYAIGDVSRQISNGESTGRRIESWQNANDQGVRAARRILGMPVEAAGLPRFWSDQFEHRIQIAGFPDPDATVLARAGQDGFWDFGAFAIAINQPERLHRFASDRRAEEQSPPALAPVPERLYPIVLDAPPEEGHLRRLSVDPFGEVVLTRVGKELFGIAEICPHAHASLAEGFLSGHRIVCPLHFAEFDLRNGQAFNAPGGCSRARVFRVAQAEDGTYRIGSLDGL